MKLTSALLIAALVFTLSTNPQPESKAEMPIIRVATIKDSVLKLKHETDSLGVEIEYTEKELELRTRQLRLLNEKIKTIPKWKK